MHLITFTYGRHQTRAYSGGHHVHKLKGDGSSILCGSFYRTDRGVTAADRADQYAQLLHERDEVKS